MKPLVIRKTDCMNTQPDQSQSHERFL